MSSKATPARSAAKSKTPARNSTTKQNRKRKAESDEVFEVKRIHNKRGSGDKAEYLVEWVGYPLRKEFTWEPVDGLKLNAEESVAAFERTLVEQRIASAKSPAAAVTPRVLPKRRRQEAASRLEHEQDDEDASSIASSESTRLVITKADVTPKAAAASRCAIM